MSRLTRHFSPAMLVAIVALLSSLTGGAIAAKLIVTGKTVKNSSLTGIDVKNRSLTGTDVKPGSVGADRLSAAARAALKGATGATGATGPQGAAGTPGTPGAPGSSTLTQTFPAGGISWGVIDIDGTSSDGTSQNGGLEVTPLTGTAVRSIFVIGTVPGVTPGGTTGNIAAVHLCYRATATTHLETVGLNRYRGDQVDQTGLQTTTALLSDTTERQDAACRRYPITGDQAIRAGDTFQLALELSTSANGNVNANRLRILSVGIETTA